ncbi:MAG: MerR family transcriptional regulator [Candidatus Acidiferrum sp.]
MTAPRGIRSGELARLVGVSRDALRYYERKGLLPPPQRSSGGYRLYPPSALQRLRAIRGALALGFTVQELAGIFRAREHNQPPCKEVRELALRKAEELRLRISELTLLRKELLHTVKRWEAILGETASGNFAYLLESFVSENPKAIDRISPLISPGLQQKLLRSRKR